MKIYLDFSHFQSLGQIFQLIFPSFGILAPKRVKKPIRRTFSMLRSIADITLHSDFHYFKGHLPLTILLFWLNTIFHIWNSLPPENISWECGLGLKQLKSDTFLKAFSLKIRSETYFPRSNLMVFETFFKEFKTRDLLLRITLYKDYWTMKF